MIDELKEKFIKNNRYFNIEKIIKIILKYMMAPYEK